MIFISIRSGFALTSLANREISFLMNQMIQDILQPITLVGCSACKMAVEAHVMSEEMYWGCPVRSQILGKPSDYDLIAIKNKWVKNYGFNRSNNIMQILW